MSDVKIEWKTDEKICVHAKVIQRLQLLGKIQMSQEVSIIINLRASHTESWKEVRTWLRLYANSDVQRDFQVEIKKLL